MAEEENPETAKTPESPDESQPTPSEEVSGPEASRSGESEEALSGKAERASSPADSVLDIGEPLYGRGPRFNFGAVIGLGMSLIVFGLYFGFDLTERLRIHEQSGSPVWTLSYVALTGLVFLLTAFFFTSLGQVVWRAIFYPATTRGKDEESLEQVIVSGVSGETDLSPKIDQTTLVSLSGAQTKKLQDIRWQGWVLGIIAVLIICFATPYIELYLASTLIAIHHLPAAAVAFHFFLILAINGLLAGAWNSRFMRRIFSLRRSDLLCVFAMSVSTAAIPTFYLMNYLIPTMLAGRYYSDKGFDDTVLAYFPEERNPDGWFRLTPKDPERPEKADYVDLEKYRQSVAPYFRDKLPAAEQGYIKKIQQEKVIAATRKLKRKYRIAQATHTARVEAVNDWERNMRRLLSLAKPPNLTSESFLVPEYRLKLLEWQTAGAEGPPPDRLPYVEPEIYLEELAAWARRSDPSLVLLGNSPEHNDYLRDFVFFLRMVTLSTENARRYAAGDRFTPQLKEFVERNSDCPASWIRLFPDSGIPPPVPSSEQRKEDPAAFAKEYLTRYGPTAAAYISKRPESVPTSLKKNGLSDEKKALTAMLAEWFASVSENLDSRMPPQVLPREGSGEIAWFRRTAFSRDSAEYRVSARPVEWTYAGVAKGEKVAGYIDENGQKQVLRRKYADADPTNPKKVRLYWSMLLRPMAKAWLKPMLTWFIIIFAAWGLMVSTSALLRKQWADRERLAFPLAQVPLEMSDSINTAGIGSFFTNRLAWIGMAIPALYHSWNMIGDFRTNWPKIPAINKYVQDTYFTEPPWNRIGLIHISFFPSVIGLAYLVSLEVSFSIWLFWLIEKGAGMLLAGAGYGSTVDSFTGSSEGGISSLFTDQGYGAMTAMVLFGFFMARGHLKDVVRKAVLGKRAADIDDSTEALSYRVGFLMFAVSFAVMVAWLVFAGLAFSWALLLITGFFIVLVGLTRLVAEGGLFYIQSQVMPYHVMQSLITPAVIGPQGMTIMGITHAAIMFDLRSMPMPSIMHSMKFAGDAGVNRRQITYAIILALVLSAVFSFFGFMDLAFKHGMASLESQGGEPWTLVTHPRDDVYGKMKSDNEKIRQYRDKMAEYEKKREDWKAGQTLAAELEAGKLNKKSLGDKQFEALSVYRKFGEAPPEKKDIVPESVCKPAKFDWWRLFSISLGAAVMVLFMFLRQRIFWWPHPIGYVVWVSPAAINRIIFSIFLGWFVKWAITKYGGLQVYYRLRRFFIGLIVGETMIAIFWIIIKWKLDYRGGYWIHIN